MKRTKQHGAQKGRAAAKLAEEELKIAAQIKDNDFHAAMLEYGMSDQMVAVVFNPALQDRIPGDVMDQVTSVERDIIAGKVALPDASHLNSNTNGQ